MGWYAVLQDSLKKEGDRIGAAMIAFLFFGAVRALMEQILPFSAATATGAVCRMAAAVLSAAVPALILRGVPFTREKGIEWTAHRAFFLILGALAFLSMYYSVSLVWASVLEGKNWTGIPAAVFPESTAERALFLAERVLISSVLEEILYRRLIMGRLLPYGEWFAVTVSATLFALAHGSLAKVVPVFLTGLALGYLYLVTGSLRACVAYHFLNNAVAVGLIRLAGAGKTDLYAEILYGLIAAGAVSILLLVFRYRGHLVRGLETERIRPGAGGILRSLPFAAATILLIMRTVTDMKAGN